MSRRSGCNFCRGVGSRHVTPGRLSPRCAIWCLLLVAVAGSSLRAQEAADPSELTPPEFGSLPWSDEQEGLGNLPARRLTSPRELLNLFNIDASQLAVFRDNQPLSEAELETLAKLLYRLPRFSVADLHRWARSLSELPEVREESVARRGEAYQISGRVSSFDSLELPPELAERFEFRRYYRVGMQLDELGWPVVLYTRVVPQSWLNQAPLDEPVSAHGLFLKLGEVIQGEPSLLMASARVAWRPDRVTQQLGVTADHVYLASLGVDIGLLGDLPASNGKPVKSEDRECFYQVLAAVRKADAKEVETRAYQGVDLPAILQAPDTQHGRLMLVRGTARRVLRVRVDDADIRERFGIDHYYQVDVFIPLRDHIVRLGDAQDDSRPTFKNSFPVTVCVAELPPDLPESSDLREEVAIGAAFFKLWSYRSRFVSAHDTESRQISPMFLGVTPRVVPLRTSTSPSVSLAIGGGFLLLLAMAWFAVWRSGKTDARVTRGMLQKRFRDDAAQLPGDDIVARDEPDFSNLD